MMHLSILHPSMVSGEILRHRGRVWAGFRGTRFEFASGSHLALHFKKVLHESPRHYRGRSATEESA